MGLIGSLLLTGLLAALVPKLRASMLHGIPAIASAVLTGSQSRRSHDAVKSALHTLAAIIYSIARILFATIIQIMDFMRPRILSAKRRVQGHTGRIGSEDVALEDMAHAPASVFFQLLSLCEHVIALVCTSAVATAKAVWRSVDQEVESWEARSARAVAGISNASLTTTESLNALTAHLRTTLSLPPMRHADDRTIAPATDIYADPETGLITLLLDLPGVAKDAVFVKLRGARLEVSAERVASRKDALVQSVLLERRPGRFMRVFEDLPTGLKPEEIKASMDMGVLTLTYPNEPVGEVLSTIVVT